MFTYDRFSHLLFGTSMIAAGGFVLFRLKKVASNQVAASQEWYRTRPAGNIVRYWMNTNKHVVRISLLIEAAIILVTGILVVCRAVWPET